MSVLEFIKVVILGIVEGITEWLPISSTGHMILVGHRVQGFFPSCHSVGCDPCGRSPVLGEIVAVLHKADPEEKESAACPQESGCPYRADFC